MTPPSIRGVHARASRSGDQDSSEQDTARISERLTAVRNRVDAAAARSRRSPSAITLVAVSKGFDVAAVRAARATGQADFGESRAQDLKEKARTVGTGVRWHFVGRLQRNKVKDVAGTANLIHSVDSLQLAEDIASVARRSNRVQRILVQVNVGGDPAKGGCATDEALGLVAKIRQIPGVACEGLMTIPPMDVDPRTLFRILRELRDDMRARFPEVQHLSMGMSADFESAVEEGATIIRLGEAIFGPRPQREGE